MERKTTTEHEPPPRNLKADTGFGVAFLSVRMEQVTSSQVWERLRNLL